MQIGILAAEKAKEMENPPLSVQRAGVTGKTTWEMLIYVAEMARCAFDTSDEDESDVF
jgi:hypothetical protein